MEGATEILAVDRFVDWNLRVLVEQTASVNAAPRNARIGCR